MRDLIISVSATVQYSLACDAILVAVVGTSSTRAREQDETAGRDEEQLPPVEGVTSAQMSSCTREMNYNESPDISRISR